MAKTPSRGEAHAGRAGFPDRRQILRLFRALPLVGGAELLRPRLAPAATRLDRVVVLGAGMAGLGAARQLKDRLGFKAPGQVVVLEARNRIGGRLHTDSSLGFPVDLGAAWIHGLRRNPITTLAATHGVPTFATDYESIRLYDRDGSLIDRARYDRLYDAVFEPALAKAQRWGEGRDNDPTLAASLGATGAGAGLSALDARVFDWHLWWNVEADSTFPTSALSTWFWGEDYEFQGPDVRFPLGYQPLAEAIASGLDVRLDHVVESIDWRQPTVVVHTNFGPISCERLVITLPLGVLKAGSVAFTPALPAAATDAISELGFGRVHKIALRFPSTFWDPAAEFIGSIGAGRADNLEILNIVPSHGVSGLLCWAVGEQAAALENQDDATAVAQMMARLRTIFGADIPAPTGVLRSTWNNSPFTRGSYSYWVVGSNPEAQRALVRDPGGRLFFAGEHTSSRYPQTVHGAWLSGIAAAQRVRARAR